MANSPDGKNDNSEQAWIQAGYAALAAQGLAGIHVEKLARELGLNKSGFYHYFGDRDTFLERLMEHHAYRGERVAHDMRFVKDFIPEFIHTLLLHKEGVLVHMQLVRHREHPILFRGFTTVNEVVDPVVIPLWASFTDLAHDLPLARQHYEMVRDMFYSRITASHMNYDYLHSLLHEARSVVLELIKKGQ